MLKDTAIQTFPAPNPTGNEAMSEENTPNPAAEGSTQASLIDRRFTYFLIVLMRRVLP
jgi:hypothetical protein